MDMSFAKILELVFRKLFICVLTVGIFIYAIEYSGVISNGALKAIILIAFAAALCLVSAVTVVKYIGKVNRAILQEMFRLTTDMREISEKFYDISEDIGKINILFNEQNQASDE